VRAPAATPSVEAVVEAAGPHLPALLDDVERRLAELATGHGELLARHAGDTIAAGGKRLRPLLVLLAAGSPLAEPERTVRCAVAVELVHSASLVHDDVLDDADLRRGRPTVFASGGRRLATATGDLLFSRAFAELALNAHADEVAVLTDASAALARGELVQRADAWRVEISLERYLERCELKTARLFEAACRLGALSAGGPEGSLARFGSRIGVAFQILDDVLDVSGPEARTGKRRGTDLLDGTVTLPLILAREHEPALATVDLRTIRSAAAAEALCDRIESTGALAEARDRALGMVAEARSGLPGLPNAQRRALELVAAGVVERYS
jgi:geranylgeranyl pyrophosphate synthase